MYIIFEYRKLTPYVGVFGILLNLLGRGRDAVVRFRLAKLPPLSVLPLLFAARRCVAVTLCASSRMFGRSLIIFFTTLS